MVQEAWQIEKGGSKSGPRSKDLERGRGDQFAERARLVAEVQTVESFPGNNQNVERGGVNAPGGRKNQAAEARNQSDSGEPQRIDDRRDREQALDAVQRQRIAVAPGVPIERCNQQEHRGESKSIQREPAVDLNGGEKPGSGGVAEQISGDGGKKKLQRVDTKKDQEQQAGIQNDGKAVAEAVAAEENVVRKPAAENHREADGHAEEAQDGFLRSPGVSWDGKRNREKNQREGENHVAENVDARDSRSAHAETVFDGELIWRVHASLRTRFWRL
jgi:hypothetical protein